MLLEWNMPIIEVIFFPAPECTVRSAEDGFTK